jgi:hypothetical protein
MAAQTLVFLKTVFCEDKMCALVWIGKVLLNRRSCQIHPCRLPSYLSGRKDYRNVTNRHQEQTSSGAFISITARISGESNSATMGTFTVQNDAVFELTNSILWIILCPPKPFPQS